MAPSRKNAPRFLAISTFVLLLACQRAAAPPAALPKASAERAAALKSQDEQLAAALKAYRQTIVLMWDEKTLDAGDRPNAYVVGKLLFEQNVSRLKALSEALSGEISKAEVIRFKEPPHLTEAFLAKLENEPSWHDADKLVFGEVVGELSGPALQSPAGKALGTRLEEDAKALTAIRELYDRELDKVFEQFQTRGMPVRREAWENYLAFLRTLYTAKSIMEEHRAEIAPRVAPRPQRAEKVLSGASLPPKTLVLTFDDGPHPRYTAQVLDILDRFKVKGIFFELGRNVGESDGKGGVKATVAGPESVKLLRAGNLVGNHTYTHALLPKLDDGGVQEEMDKTLEVLKSVDSVKPTLFRPPYGALDDDVRKEADARGMRIMLWNIDSLDWADPVPRSVANRVIGEAKKEGRGVILMHDIHGQSVEALPFILETLQAEGFQFVLWDGSQILQRGGPPAPATAATAPAPLPPLYRESWAVVVGVNDYQKWPKLSYCVADALAFRDLLVNKFAFKPENIVTLLDGDATREKILSVLGDTLANPQKIQKEDRVLVFFAGHGATRPLPSGRSLGYIVPVDAGTESFQGQCISMTNFQDIDEAIAAKHVFYVMDACYSGLALVRSGEAGNPDPRKYLAEITRRRARQMLTAGGADQAVADNGPNGHSIFTWTLLQGLDGKADLNGDGCVTAAELFAYAGPVVSSLSKQTPAFGNLAGSEGGEFVFELKHENEFLSEVSEQLNDEGIRLNAQLDAIHRSIAEKRARNVALAKEVAEAKAELKGLGGTGPEISSEKARKKIDEGLALYREKKYPEALKAFQEAHQIQPSNAQVANNIGFIHFRLGDYEKALTWYQESLALDPKRAIAWANMGEACEKLGKKADAVQAYEKFLELAPNHSSAAYVKARIKALKTS